MPDQFVCKWYVGTWEGRDRIVSSWISYRVVDKNKNALQAEDGLRVLLSQTNLDPPNVPVSALRCLEYALMNEKNRVAFAQPTYLETLRPLLTPQEDHRILCGALAVVEASLSPACLTIATLLAKDSTLGQVLGMSSQSPLIPVRAHTMRAVACLAWARPMGSLLISSLPWDALLQDENMFVALHTAGTLTNLYRATLDTSPGELPWEGIVKSLFALLDRASNPQEMKIVGLRAQENLKSLKSDSPKCENL